VKGGDEGILLKDGGFHTIKGVTIGPGEFILFSLCKYTHMCFSLTK